MSKFSPVSLVKMYLLAYNFLILTTTTVSLPPPLLKLLFSTLHYFHRLLSTLTSLIKKSPFSFNTHSNPTSPSSTNYTFFTLISFFKYPLLPPCTLNFTSQPFVPPAPHYPPLPGHNYPLNIHSLSNYPYTRKQVITILLIMSGMFYFLIFLIHFYLISSFSQTNFCLENNSVLVRLVIINGTISFLFTFTLSFIIKSKCNYKNKLPTVAIFKSRCLIKKEFFFYLFLYHFKKVHTKLQFSNWCFFINLGYNKRRQNKTQHRFQPYSEGRIIFNNGVLLEVSVDFSLIYIIAFLFYCCPTYKFLRILQIDFSSLFDHPPCFIMYISNVYIFVHFFENTYLHTPCLFKSRTALFTPCPLTFSVKNFDYLFFSLPNFILLLILHNTFTFLESLKLAILLILVFFIK